MRYRAQALVLATLSAAACGGVASTGPAGLAIGVPSPAAVTYVTGDTVVVDVDAGGQFLQVRITEAATLGASFRGRGDGVELTLDVREYRAQTVNPMASASADGSGISGPLVVNLDRQGAASVVSMPSVSGSAAEMFSPLELAHGLLPRLPGRAVPVGGSWTDTIEYSGAQGPGSVTAAIEMTYTVAGDTVVDGRSLVKLTMQGTSRSQSTGVTTGMDFEQNVTGSVKGWALWDQNRRLLVESFTESDGTGAMNVSAAPFPLGLRVKTRGWVRLGAGS